MVTHRSIPASSTTATSPRKDATDSLVDLRTGPERLKKSESDIPMGRLAKPEEIAGAVSYLLSKDASFTHGANIRVAGGRGPGTTLG